MKNEEEKEEIGPEPNHSCTHVRGPPVALHVSQQISSESWGFSGVAAVSRYTPPKRPCRTCRP